MNSTPTIFISYAHKDNESDDPNKRWLDRLREHLGPLAAEGVISAWSDRDLEIGDKWHGKIQAALSSAKVAVLLVSPPFLDSEYIRNNELPILLRRADEEGVSILPVILRPCLYRTTTFKYPDPVDGPEVFSLAELQASNPPNKALSEMDEAQQDRVLLSVAERIQGIFKGGNDGAPGTEATAEPIDRKKARRFTARSRAELNRERMIERVRNDWIEGILEKSLYQIARVDLGLEPKPDAVQKPWDLVVHQPEQDSKALTPGARISNVFDDMSEALLILGAPGAGKTIMLLELARDLLDRAERNPVLPIPVVFNLSTWAEHRGTLADWLMDELNKRYDVPKKIANEWLNDDGVLPLLDGLDEVAKVHREGCVKAINQFHQEHGLVPIAVCSRIEEYEALTARLGFPGAIAIQPLNRNQVDDYFKHADEPLARVRTALQNDETLWELFDTPLMLTVASMAYRGRSAEELHTPFDTGKDHRRQLFAMYIDTMFQRPGRSKTQGKRITFTKDQTIAWLIWLADAMKHHGQTVLYLGWMQPDWLKKSSKIWIFRTGVGVFCALIVGLLYGLLGGLTNGLSENLSSGLKVGLGNGLRLGVFFGLISVIKKGNIGALIFGLLVGPIYGIVAGLVSGLIDGPLDGLTFGLYFGLFGLIGIKTIGFSGYIQPVETISWSWERAQHSSRYGLVVGLIIGLLIWAINSIKSWLIVGVLRVELLGALVIGLLFGLLGGLSFGLFGGLSGRKIATRIFPNEEIKRSVIRAISGLFIIGLSIGLLFGLLGGMVGGLSIGMIGGLIAGLSFGGLAAIQHYTLRLILWRKNYAPLRYVRFLDHAADLIFLRKVGGGYIFTHRMLMDYFASLGEEGGGRSPKPESK